jgi:hypothetical protein
MSTQPTRTERARVVAEVERLEHVAARLDDILRRQEELDAAQGAREARLAASINAEARSYVETAMLGALDELVEIVRQAGPLGDPATRVILSEDVRRFLGRVCA